MALTQEQAKIYVEALESDKYKQAFYTLASSDGCYCATGVACVLFVDPNITKTRNEWSVYNERYHAIVNLIGKTLFHQIVY